MELPLFEDRLDAGRRLADQLHHYTGREETLVLGLPRGGVPVAFEIARALHLPLEIFLVRKLGYPGQSELAMGAIASGGVTIYNDELVSSVPKPEAARILAEETKELKRREKLYRGDRPYPSLRGKNVILVDDGLATGASMRAAAIAVRAFHPARLIIAVPVGPLSACKELEAFADELICAETPDPFSSVGAWYGDFSQTSDAEVMRILEMNKECLDLV